MGDDKWKHWNDIARLRENLAKDISSDAIEEITSEIRSIKRHLKEDHGERYISLDE